ncbi:metal ABC transporter solute-binding protein, Zn/Mn family [Williamsia herbipolensis]|uniref:metal ABC transporter solute-binding protein, Zn/Mn family n=1 Tax=Williamsia herbipolensis TaxID=1603258 RepID=UPI0005F86D77|nr:zinc ABC transporter substrate-binding protein [Williamsia herbipolensis]
MSSKTVRGVSARVAGLAAAVIAATVVAGCSGDTTESAGAPGEPVVVASTDVWGSVASAVAGKDAGVTSLYTSPDGDPHEFEATARDTAKVFDADVVVLNGADYDAYMEKAPKNPDAKVISACDAYKKLNPSAPTGAGEVNEHFFYDFDVVKAVASDIADALAEKFPADKDAFAANAKQFEDKVTDLQTTLASIKAAHAGAKVAQTEPLAAYLLAEAGLVDATPSSFTDAVEAGNDPPAAAVATTEDLVRNKTVSALLYNTQAVDETTKRLLAAADSDGLPVVKLTETLPSGVTDYVAWQKATVDAIAASLSR